MSYKTCRIKNVSESEVTVCGKILTVNEVYQIPDLERITWANNDDVLVHIGDGVLQIGDGENFFATVNDQINWLKDY